MEPPPAEDVSRMPDPADNRSPGQQQMSREEKAAFEGRISDLGERLGKVKAQRQAGADAELDAEMRGRGMAYGMRMAAELVGAVIVGALHRCRSGLADRDEALAVPAVLPDWVLPPECSMW